MTIAVADWAGIQGGALPGQALQDLSHSPLPGTQHTFCVCALSCSVSPEQLALVCVCVACVMSCSVSPEHLHYLACFKPGYHPRWLEKAGNVIMFTFNTAACIIVLQLLQVASRVCCPFHDTVLCVICCFIC